MTELLETVIEAHGGLERWNQLDAVSARLAQGGAQPIERRALRLISAPLGLMIWLPTSPTTQT